MKTIQFGLLGAVLCVVAGVAAASGSVLVLVVALVLPLGAVIALTRRRFDAADSAETDVVVPLVLLPTFAGLAVFSELGAGILIWGCVVWAMLRGRRGVGQIEHWYLVAALVVAIALPASRFASTLEAQWWHVGAFVLLLVCVLRHPVPAVVPSLLDGVGLYLIANVAAHMAGVVSPAAADRTFGTDSSIGGVRVFFPLTANLAVPALLAAVFVGSGLLCFERRGAIQVFRMTAFLAGCYIMVAANTRVALLVSVLVFLASVGGPRSFARVSVAVGATGMVLPFAYGYLSATVIQPLATSVGRALPFLSRGDAAGDAALEGRSDIWARAISFWQENADVLHRLVGYGELGQQSSGASVAYSQGGSSLLRGFSTHNSTLQQLFDGGLVGVAALAVAGLGATWVLSREALRGSRIHLLATCAIVAGLLGGGTEVTQAPGYATESFWIFVGLVLVAAVSRAGPEAEVEVDLRDRKTDRSVATR